MSEEGQALGCVCAWGWVGGGGVLYGLKHGYPV